MVKVKTQVLTNRSVTLVLQVRIPQSTIFDSQFCNTRNNLDDHSNVDTKVLETCESPHFR